MLALAGMVLMPALANAGPHGPTVTSWLQLGACDSNVTLVFMRNTTTQVIAATTSSGTPVNQMIAAMARGVAGGVVRGCLTYGGFHEQNTGLAACTGWADPGIGGQRWTLSPSTRMAVGAKSVAVQNVGNQGKALGVWDCGNTAGAAVVVCTLDGDDCGPNASGCPAAFAWKAVAVAATPTSAHAGATAAAATPSMRLQATTPATGSPPLCLCTSAHPPPPAPPAPPSPRPAGGGGPWSVVCNASAACPVENTCCKLASGNWGCVPAPNAVCCPGGAIGCPGGSHCHQNAPAYTCAVGTAPSGPARQTVQPTWRARPARPAARQDGDRRPRWVARAARKRKGTTAVAVLTVTSQDGATTVSIDSQTGVITSIAGAGHAFAAQAETTMLLQKGHQGAWRVTVVPLGASVVVTRTLPGHVVIMETLSPGPGAAVEWAVRATGDSATVYTAPITSAVTFAPGDDADLQWWAPWDRGSYASSAWTNPLRPSDGHTGFWNGSYNYGRVYGSPKGTDMVVAPIVAVLHGASNTGFSLHMDPGDPGIAWAENCLESTTSDNGAGFAWHRSNLRLDRTVVQTFSMHIVTHAACWRPALGWHVLAYPRHWTPNARPDRVALVDGLGSYGSDPIPQLGQNDSALHMPIIRRMHYKTNWDLSGRFYHYMGMYAPPVGDGAPERWLNRWNPFGSRGGRLTYNVSYSSGPDSISDLYGRVQALGYSTLSYMNVFEFGMNVLGHATGAPVSPKPDDYRNATLYAQNALSDAVLRANWNAEDGTVHANQGAWDRGILMDPGRTSYTAEMVQQTARRVAKITNFQGMVVDRSDYARYYNLLHNDGVTFTGAAGYNMSWSMKRSYLDVMSAVRHEIGANHVMLMNSLGYSSLSFMPSYDGTFSEGTAFNAVGLLGAGGMVNIMWTSSAAECCTTAAHSDLYFQRRLFMGVYPMAPIPASDHCISYDPATAALYASYGPLYASLAGKRYNFAPHAVTVSGATTAVANAFVLANGTAVYPVVLSNTSTVVLELRSVATSVAGFEATFPGDAAGVWTNVEAWRVSKGTWAATVVFADSKENHACLLRSK